MNGGGGNEEEEEDYYEILGVSPTADAKTIRKAYLKLSLQTHPDKNPEQPEQAQQQFVRIGRAYKVLSDTKQRADYDRRRRGGVFANGFGTAYTSTTEEGTNPPPPPPQSYETYREAFDATMAGLSKDELREVMGAAALIGSVVGSILGSRLAKQNKALSGLGSLVGSAVAREAATTLVGAAHKQAKQRTIEAQEERARVARGEPPRQQSSSKWDDLLRKATEVAKEKAVNHIFNTSTGGNSGAPGR